MLLTLGADLFTTSKLLGHKNIETTQIYAKIVDQKKVETINLMDNYFGNTSETKNNLQQNDSRTSLPFAKERQ